MNSKELYCNLYQILDGTGRSYPEDFDRPLHLHVSRASGGNISHITTEFGGVRAKFFCCLMFDGSGDTGTGLPYFAMPKVKLTTHQRAAMALSTIQYLIEARVINGDMNYFKEKIFSELNGGIGSFLAYYERLCRSSAAHVMSRSGSVTV
jgi:hypothetical protein